MMKYSIAHRIKKALSVLLCAGSVIVSALYPDPAAFSVLSYNVLAQQPYEKRVVELFGALDPSELATHKPAHVFDSGQRAGVFKQSFALLSSPVDFLGAQEWPADPAEQSSWTPPVAFSNPHFHETAPGSHGLYTAADETRSLGSRAGNVYTSNRFIAEVRKVKNVPVGDYKVLFINCHLPHGQDKQDAVITEIRNHLTTQITTYKVHDCVLFGDFNTDAFGETGRERINGLLQSLPHPDEKPWKNAAKKEFGKMWYKETTMRGQTVDFMFYTSGLYLKMLEKSPSADLISKAPVPTGASIPELKWCSDHAALFACFQVNVLHPSYLSRITGHQQAVAEAQRDAEADRAEQKQDRQDRRAERLKERLEAEKKVCDTLNPEVDEDVKEMRESECLAWQMIANEAKDRRSEAQSQESARRKCELDFWKALKQSCGWHHTDDFPGGQSNHKKQTGGREKSPASSSSEGRNGTSSSSSLSCSASCEEGRQSRGTDDTGSQKQAPKKKKKKKKKTTTACLPKSPPQPSTMQPLQPREYAHDHEALLDQLSKLLDTSPTSRSILKIEEYPFPDCFQKFLDRKLFQEAEEGNCRRIETLLNCGANPNMFHLMDVPPELLKELRCKERDLAGPGSQEPVVGPGNTDSFTPLMIACHGGYYHQTVKQLLKAGADVNAQSKYWRLSPLMLSCNGGYKQCCKLLLNHKKYQPTAPELLINITDRTMEPATAHAYQRDKNGGDEEGSLFDLLVKRDAWPVRGNCRSYYEDEEREKLERALRCFYTDLEKKVDLRKANAHQDVEQLIKDLFDNLNRAEVKIFRHPFAYAIIRPQGDKCSDIPLVLLPIPACLWFARERSITYASAKDFGSVVEVLMRNGASCLHDCILSSLSQVKFIDIEGFGKRSRSLAGEQAKKGRSFPPGQFRRGGRNISSRTQPNPPIHMGRVVHCVTPFVSASAIFGTNFKDILPLLLHWGADPNIGEWNIQYKNNLFDKADDGNTLLHACVGSCPMNGQAAHFFSKENATEERCANGLSTIIASDVISSSDEKLNLLKEIARLCPYPLDWKCEEIAYNLLGVALDYSEAKIFQFLLLHRADPFNAKLRGVDALSIAIHQQSGKSILVNGTKLFDIIKTMIELLEDPTVKDGTVMSPLMFFILGCYVQIGIDTHISKAAVEKLCTIATGKDNPFLILAAVTNIQDLGEEFKANSGISEDDTLKKLFEYMTPVLENLPPPPTENESLVVREFLGLTKSIDPIFFQEKVPPCLKRLSAQPPTQ